MIAISLPFRIDGYGRVTATSDPRKVWADRVRFVICTYFGERIMRPTFGSGLANTVFADLEDAPELITVAAQQAFAEHLPYLTLIEVTSVSEDPGNGMINLELLYEIPDFTADPITQTVDLRMN